MAGNNKLAFSTDGSTDSTPNVSIRASGNDTYFSNWSGSAYSDRMMIQGSTGNIGIGTIAPSEKLQVAGNVLIGDSGSLIFNDPSVKISIPAVNALAFFTSGSERVRINNAGNIGFGVTNPQYKLDINGGVGTALRIAGGGDIQIDAQTDPTDDNKAVLYNDSGKLSLTSGMVILGNSSIGTSAPDDNFKLTLSGGGIKAESNTANPAGYFSSSGDGFALMVKANKSDKAALDVNGGINFNNQKVCSAVAAGNWRSDLLVPASWTLADCRYWATS